jgi:hypothetical protein
MAFGLELGAIDGTLTFEAERTGRMARGPKVSMRKAVIRDLSDGSKTGTRLRSFARMPACSSAVSAISLNRAALPGSLSDAATTLER